MSETVLNTLNARIGKKGIALAADELKIDNVGAQILVYENLRDRTREAADLKRAEIDEMVTLKEEAVELLKKRSVLQEYTDGLIVKFDAYGWEPNMPYEKTLASTDYHEKVEERHQINARLKEIEKEANKIYYRR